YCDESAGVSFHQCSMAGDYRDGRRISVEYVEPYHEKRKTSQRNSVDNSIELSFIKQKHFKVPALQNLFCDCLSVLLCSHLPAQMHVLIDIKKAAFLRQL